MSSSHLNAKFLVLGTYESRGDDYIGKLVQDIPEITIPSFSNDHFLTSCEKEQVLFCNFDGDVNLHSIPHNSL